MKSLLKMLVAGASVEELPVLPRIHDGRTEALRLAYTNRDMRFVLRLWSANTTIAKDDRPLYIGTVEQQQRKSIAGLITMAGDSGAYDRSLNELEQALGDGFNQKLVGRTNHEIEMQVEHEQQRLEWHGKVLLVWEKKR